MPELTRIMYPVTGERLVIDASQFAKPDPRDVRIAELEAALRKVRGLTTTDYGVAVSERARLQTIHDTAANALMPEPERSMEVADEELGY